MTRPMMPGSAPKPAAPEAVAEISTVRVPPDSSGVNVRPNERPTPSTSKKSVADAHAVDPLRLASAGEVEPLADRIQASLSKVVFRVRKSVTSPGEDGSVSNPIFCWTSALNSHGITSRSAPRIRQRLQQHAVDDAEDRGVAADAEGQRRYRHCGESRSACECADGRANILHAAGERISEPGPAGPASIASG